MFGRKKTKLERAQETGVRVIEQVQDALHHLPVEEWQDKLHELKENAGELVERTRSMAVEHAQDAAERAQDTAGRARAAAMERAREAADTHDLDAKKEAVAGAVSAAHKAVSERMRHRHEQAHQVADEAMEQAEEYLPHQESGFSRWLWLGAGMILGGAIALVLAPASGRRSRALLRDKLNQGKQRAEELGKTAGEAVSNTVATATERVHDAAQEAQETASTAQREMAETVQESAESITERVRQELGKNPLTRDLERMNVSFENGVVTLRGPQLDAKLQSQVEKFVGALPGIKEVRIEPKDEKPQNQAPKAEPAKTEASKAELPKAEPAKAEPAKAEVPKPETPKAATSKA